MDIKNKYDIIGYVIASYYRIKTLKILSKSMKMPSEIAKELYNKYSQVSTALSELKRIKLVICINESKTKGRFYKITENGKEILKNIEELNIAH